MNRSVKRLVLFEVACHRVQQA